MKLTQIALAWASIHCSWPEGTVALVKQTIKCVSAGGGCVWRFALHHTSNADFTRK